MTPHLLRTAGEALYGLQWQSAVARDLGVADRTVRRWLNGSVPSYVAAELELIARERVHALVDLVSHLSRQSVTSFSDQRGPMLKPDSTAVDQPSDFECIF